MTATLAPPNPHRGKVDRDRAIVHDVKVCGAQSKKGHTYSPQALADIARLAEDCPVNIDHIPVGSRRSLKDRIARLRNVRVQGGSVIGELHFNKSHRLTPQCMDDAENSPRSLGLSIDADGQMENSGGQREVKGVSKLRSVDLVANPATANSLFESEGDAGGYIRRSLHGATAGGESPIFKAERLRRTIEKYSVRDRYHPIVEDDEPAADDVETDRYEADPATLPERMQKYMVRDRHVPEPYNCLDHLTESRHEDNVPVNIPESAPLAQRIARFAQK